jgi:uncharacterized protein (DUF1800 family)
MQPAKLKTLAALGALALAGGLAPGRQVAATEPRPAPSRLPWKEAGLSERQAAAHLLNRFAFGPRPGDIDRVVAGGLDRWFEIQLAADTPDPNLDARLHELPALSLPETDQVRIYRNPGQILAQAVREGVISKDEVAAAKADKTLQELFRPNAAGRAGGAAADQEMAHPELRARLLAFARQRGYRPERELQQQLTAQKLIRATDALNQLQEVMTDFWFNHFNVSSTNGQARPYLLAYERDAIRPAALGTVRALLAATARSPAMLYYLNNAESTASPDAPTLLGDEMQAMRANRPANRRFGVGPPPPSPAAGKPANRPGARGLNENYARELMELHTLGVDGGYTQKDVIEVARAFTGWTVLPSGPARESAEKRLEKVRQYGGLGFRTEGDFLFRADMHDDGPKVVLGHHLAPGRGIEDGETVLDLLANNSATARHLCTQLAARFVADQPPPALVDRLVAAYNRSAGDVRELLRTLVRSPEFWSREAVGAKVKSPFELAVSAVRAAGARVENPAPLAGWIARMGEPLYAYQAPTGYPDRADAWVNTGSLLNRMNFGLQLAAQRIPGIDMDLPSLRDGREPESRDEALSVYAALILPGRDLAPTLKLLTPMLAEPALVHRVDAAAPPPPRQAAAGGEDDEDPMDAPGRGAAAAAGGEAPAARLAASGGSAADPGGAGGAARRPRFEIVHAFAPQHPPTPIEQVVGLILGSPEFQRR